MASHTAYMEFDTDERREFVRITDDVQRAVDESGVREGMVLVSAMHITAGVWVNDDEPGILADTLEWLAKLPPPPGEEHANNAARPIAPAPAAPHAPPAPTPGTSPTPAAARTTATRTGRTCSSTTRSSCRSPTGSSTSGRGRPSSTPSSTAAGPSDSSSRGSGSRYAARHFEPREHPHGNGGSHGEHGLGRRAREGQRHAEPQERRDRRPGGDVGIAHRAVGRQDLAGGARRGGAL